MVPAEISQLPPLALEWAFFQQPVEIRGWILRLVCVTLESCTFLLRKSWMRGRGKNRDAAALRGTRGWQEEGCGWEKWERRVPIQGELHFPLLLPDPCPAAATSFLEPKS